MCYIRMLVVTERPDYFVRFENIPQEYRPISLSFWIAQNSNTIYTFYGHRKMDC